MPELPVASVVGALFGWHHQVSFDVVFELVESLTERIQTQHDYLSLISWVSLALHGAGPIDPLQEEILLPLMRLRVQFPEIGTERYGWARLGERLCIRHAIEVADVLVQLVQNHSVFMMAQDEEPALLRVAAQANQTAVWNLVGNVLLADEWRMTMGVRGWITDLFEAQVIEEWVGDSDARAERVDGCQRWK